MPGETAPKRIAILGSLVLHAVLALVILTGRFDLQSPSVPPKAIDLVSVEALLPPPPLVAPAAAPAPSPQPIQAPAAAPAAAPSPSPAPATAAALAEDLAPAAADSGGMTAATGPAIAGAAGAQTPAAPAGASAEPDYLPQFKITDAPVVPAKSVLAKIAYPPLAAKQGIEATVYLELLIDAAGKIRKVTVLKDPGYGFAEAAVTALAGIVCTPAMIDGQAVAVRFRYPVRFALK